MVPWPPRAAGEARCRRESSPRRAGTRYRRAARRRPPAPGRRSCESARRRSPTSPSTATRRRRSKTMRPTAPDPVTVVTGSQRGCAVRSRCPGRPSTGANGDSSVAGAWPSAMTAAMPSGSPMTSNASGKANRRRVLLVSVRESLICNHRAAQRRRDYMAAALSCPAAGCRAAAGDRRGAQWGSAAAITCSTSCAICCGMTATMPCGASTSIRRPGENRRTKASWALRMALAMFGATTSFAAM